MKITLLQQQQQQQQNQIIEINLFDCNDSYVKFMMFMNFLTWPFFQSVNKVEMEGNICFITFESPNSINISMNCCSTGSSNIKYIRIFYLFGIHFEKVYEMNANKITYCLLHYIIILYVSKRVSVPPFRWSSQIH